jgi:pimeloyl-ACP methyl ester carboxylesterase
MNATTLPTATVLVDGLRIRYADSGTDGPVILLTSPWPESLFAFRRVWPALARTGRLVAMDLPRLWSFPGGPAPSSGNVKTCTGGCTWSSPPRKIDMRCSWAAGIQSLPPEFHDSSG